MLESTFGESAFSGYRVLTDYEKAVFVNTTVAAAYVKADFSNATFEGFYRADFNYENGIYVTGVKGIKRGRHKIGGFLGTKASVEFEKGHIDVDLYHSGFPYFMSSISHAGEVSFNKRHKRGTHPRDVVKRLKDAANINTGVSCD